MEQGTIAQRQERPADPAGRPPTSDAPLGREVWVVAGVVVLGIFMSILDTTSR